MTNGVTQTSSAASVDNDVIVNVNDYDNDKPERTCCPKEIKVCVTIKLKDD